MGKKVSRHRPVIESVQKNVVRDEHRQCSTPGCKNIIARWVNKTACSRCRLGSSS